MWCFWCVFVVLCRFPRRRIKGGFKAKRWKKRRKDRASKEGEKGRKVPRVFGAAQMGSPPHLRGLHPVLKKKILHWWGLHPTDGVSTLLHQNRGCPDGVSTPLTGSPPHWRGLHPMLLGEKARIAYSWSVWRPDRCGTQTKAQGRCLIT